MRNYDEKKVVKPNEQGNLTFYTSEDGKKQVLEVGFFTITFIPYKPLKAKFKLMARIARLSTTLLFSMITFSLCILLLIYLTPLVFSSAPMSNNFLVLGPPYIATIFAISLEIGYKMLHLFAYIASSLPTKLVKTFKIKYLKIWGIMNFPECIGKPSLRHLFDAWQSQTVFPDIIYDKIDSLLRTLFLK